MGRRMPARALGAATAADGEPPSPFLHRCKTPCMVRGSMGFLMHRAAAPLATAPLASAQGFPARSGSAPSLLHRCKVPRGHGARGPLRRLIARACIDARGHSAIGARGHPGGSPAAHIASMQGVVQRSPLLARMPRGRALVTACLASMQDRAGSALLVKASPCGESRPPPSPLVFHRCEMPRSDRTLD